MRPRLDERGRRLFCAAEARSVGYGGVSVVARATGIARCTINRGLKDLKSLDPAPSKLRRPGGGRPALTQTRSYVTGRLARPAGVDDAGRPYATAAVGVQEPCEARARVARHGTSGFGEPDTATAGTSGLPPSGQPQESGGRSSTGPERSIRTYQRAGRSLSGRRSARDLGRHEEEGNDRPLQKRRQRLSSPKGCPERRHYAAERAAPPLRVARRCAAIPRPAKPSSSIAQVAGSGTAERATTAPGPYMLSY
jgi:hypothetical protein